MVKATYKTKYVVWGSGFQRVSVHGHCGGQHRSRKAKGVAESSHLTHKHEAERVI